jgi:hypothetical protein
VPQPIQVAVLLIALSLFAAETSSAQDTPPSSRWFEISKPHVAKRADQYVLAYNITSTVRTDRFWALVEINNPDGSRRCEWLKTLEPKQAYRFECPLEEKTAQKYATSVRVYSDAKLEDREVFYRPELTVTTEMLETASAGADRAGPTVVPDGVVEGVEAALPATFKPTWYRRLDRGFSMRAYEHSGDLTISAEQLTFVDGKTTVRIPFAQITSVRWEAMPGDIANHWVVVRFTNEAGTADAVGFRDGGRLGLRGSTGPIYVALRRTAKK